MAVTAFREKLDGVEAMQIVAHTTSGKRVAFVWCGKFLIRVQAQGSALYELVYESGSMVFYLLSGTPAQDLNVRKHPWLPLCQQDLLPLLNKEGAILRINEQEFRVKNRRTLNLRYLGVVVTDFQNNVYQVTDLPQDYRGIVEIELLSPRAGKYIRPRKDRTFPDSVGMVTTVMKSALLKDFIPLVPMATEIHSMAIMPVSGIPSASSAHEHRAAHRSQPWLACHSWLQPKSSPASMEYLSAVARALFEEFYVLTPEMLHADLVSRHLYANGCKLAPAMPVDFRQGVSLKKVVIGGPDVSAVAWISNRPLRTTLRVIRLRFSDYPCLSAAKAQPYMDTATQHMVFYVSVPIGKPQFATLHSSVIRHLLDPIFFEKSSYK